MRPDDHDLAGAYAADALTPDERSAFEEHLNVCPACRAEVSGYWEALAAVAESLAVEPPAAPSIAPARRPRVWVSLAAAAAVVVAFSVGAMVGRQTAPPVAQGEIVALASASDLQAIPVDMMGTRGTLMKSQKMGETAFLAADLPIPPKKMCYQIWRVAPDGTKTSAGLVVPDAAGNVAVVLDTADDAASYVITMEPPGGSASPTGEMVGQSQA